MRIIVMGGSFNPPTIAHQKLMLAAVDALQADMGIYVPASHEYVKRAHQLLSGAGELAE